MKPSNIIIILLFLAALRLISAQVRDAGDPQSPPPTPAELLRTLEEKEKKAYEQRRGETAKKLLQEIQSKAPAIPKMEIVEFDFFVEDLRKSWQRISAGAPSPERQEAVETLMRGLQDYFSKAPPTQRGTVPVIDAYRSGVLAVRDAAVAAQTEEGKREIPHDYQRRELLKSTFAALDLWEDVRFAPVNC